MAEDPRNATAANVAAVATAEALTRIADVLERLLPLAQFVPALVGLIVEEISKDGGALNPGDPIVARAELDRLAEIAREGEFLP